jgi:hypothetical protein
MEFSLVLVLGEDKEALRSSSENNKGTKRGREENGKVVPVLN